MKSKFTKNKFKANLVSLAFSTLLLTDISNAQTFGDYTQVGTIDFIEFPSVGDQPPEAKFFDTDFAGKWLPNELIRVNEAAFDASSNTSAVTVDSDTLLTPRGGPLRVAVAQGTALIDTVENSINTDMFNTSLWCIGSLEDGDPTTDNRASATFALPTVDLKSNETIEWTVWVSPDSKYPDNLVAVGGWGIESLVKGNSLFQRDDMVVFKERGTTLTIRNEAINEPELQENNMSTFWVGARVVPEPSSTLLSMVGLIGLLARRQR